MTDAPIPTATGEFPTADVGEPMEFVGETQELQFVVPLLRQAQARIGKPVVIYIPGGIRIDGDLTDVDETDLTLTIVDGTRQYDIALASVAVIEGKR